MTKTKSPSSLAQPAENPLNFIRWLMILAAIGLVGSFAIGLLLKRQPANAQSSSIDAVPAQTAIDRGVHLT